MKVIRAWEVSSNYSRRYSKRYSQGYSDRCTHGRVSGHIMCMVFTNSFNVFFQMFFVDPWKKSTEVFDLGRPQGENFFSQVQPLAGLTVVIVGAEEEAHISSSVFCYSAVFVTWAPRW